MPPRPGHLSTRPTSVGDTRFHDLRHTCATLLLGKGVHPKFVQELLGHANIAITLDTYSHLIPGMGDVTARAMEDALRGADPLEDRDEDATEA